MKEDKARYIQALIDTRELEDLEIFQNCMIELHCEQLKRDIDSFRASMELDADRNVGQKTKMNNRRPKRLPIYLYCHAISHVDGFPFRTFNPLFRTKPTQESCFFLIYYISLHPKIDSMQTHLVISTSMDLLRVRAEHIFYIQSDGNYSNLFLVGGEIRLLTCQLGQVEKMIAEQLPELGRYFVRIGRNLIINLDYVYYINVGKQQLMLADNPQNRTTLNASKEALKALKELIEKGGI